MKKTLWFLFIFLTVGIPFFSFAQVTVFDDYSSKIKSLMVEISVLESEYRRAAALNEEEKKGTLDKGIKTKREALSNHMKEVGAHAQKGEDTAQLVKALATKAHNRLLGDTFATTSKEKLPDVFTDLPTEAKEDISHAESLGKLSRAMKVLSEDPEGDQFLELNTYGLVGAHTGLDDKWRELRNSALRKKREEEKFRKGESSDSSRDDLHRANAAYNRAFAEAYQATAEALSKDLKVVKTQKEFGDEGVKFYRELAAQIGQADPKESLYADAYRQGGCVEGDQDPKKCADKFYEESKAYREAGKMVFRQRKAGIIEDPKALESARDTVVTPVLATSETPTENKEGCLSAVMGKIGDVASGAVTVGGKVAAFTGSAAVGAGGFILEHGASIGQGLFPIFSALAQYQYTKKGSQSSDTELYRGLAIALGTGLGAAEKLPPGAEKLIDPLNPFKREPVFVQERMAEEHEALRDALTMGGNPDKKNGFPYGTHDQLESILRGSAKPGDQRAFPIPGPSYQPSHIYDPSYFSFSGQAYNGFPPLPNTPVKGAFLNPQFGSQNPFSKGSGMANLNRLSVGPTSGLKASRNMLSATSLERRGIESFADKLEGINPPDNSLASLVDQVGPKEARQRALNKSSKGIQGLLTRGRQSEDALMTLRIERDNEYSNLVNQIQAGDSRIPELIRTVQKHHALVVRDEDGLMQTAGRDWSKNMQAYMDALRDLREITQRRASNIEGIALLQRDFELYKRIKGQRPSTVPSQPPAKPAASFRDFLIKPLWAKEEKIKSEWVSNWRDILQTENQKIQEEMIQNKRELSKLVPELKAIASLNPDGVHELNMSVVHAEKMNMRAIAFQMKQNLDKLSKAEETLKTSTEITTQEREELSKDVKNYRSVIAELEKEATACEYQLSRIETLQFEKVKRYETFQHEKELAEKLLNELVRPELWGAAKW